NLFLSIIKISHHDRHVRFQSDKIESFFPILGPFPGTFRCDGQLKPLTGLETFHHLIGHRRTFTTIHWNTSLPVKQQIKREKEPLFLNKETGVTPDRGIKKFPYNKIPVT